VYLDQQYDLTQWFIENSNSLHTIYVNNTPITPGEAEAYEFTGTEGDLVDIKFQDNVDNTCKVERTFTIRECSLESISTGGAVTITNTIPLPNNQAATTVEYLVKSFFLNTAPNTIYKVAINFINAAGTLVTFGPVDIIINPNATTSQNPTVPADKVTTYLRYYNTVAGGNTLGNILTQQGLSSDAIQSVAFTARTQNQGFVCTASTINLTNPTDPEVSPDTPIPLRYFAPPGPPYDPTAAQPQACGVANTTDIYIIQPGGGAGYGPEDILTEGLLIYQDQNGTTYAPAGTYSNNEPNSPYGTFYYRYWDGNGNWGATIFTC
jgi:hypothetical protein